MSSSYHGCPHYLGRHYACILELSITSEITAMAHEPIACDKIVAERKRNMPVFQVTSRTVQPFGRPTRRTRHTNWWRDFMLRLLVAGLIISVLATLLPRFGLSVLFFLLLPVIVSVLTAYPHHYGHKVLLFRACLAFLYFSGITGWELLTHNSTVAEYVVVTTTLALAVMFEPLRTYVQTFMEQRFHLSDDASLKAVEAFTSTLREEIDLNKVQDGLLTVVQQTMQPQAVSVWIRKTVQHDLDSLRPHNGPEENQRYKQEFLETAAADLYSKASTEITIANNDTMIDYVLNNPGAIGVDRIHMDSPILRMWKANGVEIVVPFVSQRESIGLLSLGPRLNGRQYSREDRGLLNTLAAQTAPALRVAQVVQEQQAQ